MGMENLETRVIVLEKEMQWAKGNMESIKTDLQELKAGQYRLLEHFVDLHHDMGELRGRTDERISNLQAHTDERISALQAHTDERISALQAHTDERFTALQAHTDERISALQAHTDAQFVEVHKEFAGVHKEIAGLHGSISVQTRWILAALLGGAILYPISQKLIDRLFAPPPPDAVLQSLPTLKTR